jgi:hypothetical protein
MILQKEQLSQVLREIKEKLVPLDRLAVRVFRVFKEHRVFKECREYKESRVQRVQLAHRALKVFRGYKVLLGKLEVRDLRVRLD